MPRDETRRLLRVFGVAETAYEDAVQNRSSMEELRKSEREVRARLEEVTALITGPLRPLSGRLPCARVRPFWNSHAGLTAGSGRGRETATGRVLLASRLFVRTRSESA